MSDRARDEDREEDEDEQLVREAWADARFSMDDALRQSAGGGLLTSDDQLSPYEKARLQIRALLSRQLRDAVLEQAMDLWIDLHRQHIESHAGTPAAGLLALVEELLQREELFVEFVRLADVHHGQLMQERPIFQQPGEPARPDDPYTFDSVRRVLEALLSRLRPPGFRAS